LLRKELYVKAISWSQNSFQLVQIIGPFIAAGIIALSRGPRTALVVDALTFVVATSMTLLIRFPARTSQEKSSAKKPPFFQSLSEGAAFLLKSHILRYATSINILKAIMQSVLLVGSVLYIKSEMGLSATSSDSLYGVVVTAIGIGVMVGTTLVGTVLHNWNRRLLIVGGLLLQGLAFLLLLFHPNAIVTVIIFWLSGFGSSGAMTPNSAFYAESTPNEVRGRVYSVVNAVLQVAQLIGYSLAGLIASTYSSSILFLFGGVVLLIAAPLLTFLFRPGVSTSPVLKA
jgi:MFS family permease